MPSDQDEESAPSQQKSGEPSSTDIAELKPKPVSKPDKKAVEKQQQGLQSTVDEIKAEIAELDKQIDAVRSKIETAQSARSGQQGELQKERAKRDEIKSEVDRIKAERDALSSELDRIKGRVDSALESSKSQKAQMKFRTVKEIDEEIARLEKQQSTTSMKLAEEKKLVKEIELLRGQKKQLAALGQSTEQISKERDEKTRVTTELKAKRDEFSEAMSRFTAQREHLEQMQNKDESRGLLGSLIEEKNKLYEKKKEAVGRSREIHQQIKAKWDDFKAARRAYDAYQKEEQKAYEAEKRARQEEHQRKLEEEEMKKVPYEEEMALCEYLISYLKKAFLSAEALADGAGSTQSKRGAGLEMDGKMLKAFKRDDDEDEEEAAALQAKKKGGGKKKAKKDTIVHSPDTLASFSLLNLEAPKSVAAVEKSVTELKEKKEWFSVQPRPPRKTASTEDKDEKATNGNGGPEKGGKKKRQAKEFKKVEEEFPALGLGGAAANGVTAED